MHATLLLGGGAADLVSRLQTRLGEPVVPCDGLVAGVRVAVTTGARRLVVISASLQPDDGTMAQAVRLACQRWPFLEFHAAPPLMPTEWAAVVRAAVPVDCDGVIVTVRPCGDPLVDSNVARIAWLLERDLDGVPALGALHGSEEGALRRLGARRPVVLPVDAATSVLVERLASRHAEAVRDVRMARPDWGAVASRREDDDEASLRALDQRINALLPPMYEGRYDAVRPQSMGTAPLAYDADGKVAWDQMWTSFCDLALAGGPAHRGTLLEAVTAEEANASRAAYDNVVVEIERGIGLVCGLPIVRSRTAGWVGVRADDEAMAVWMLRAIIVENVMARREGEVLYLPAGPRFTLKREIKNVVTVIAKTHHYWTAHRNRRAEAAPRPT